MALTTPRGRVKMTSTHVGQRKFDYSGLVENIREVIGNNTDAVFYINGMPSIQRDERLANIGKLLGDRYSVAPKEYASKAGRIIHYGIEIRLNTAKRRKK
jgi:hypothetical protein